MEGSGKRCTGACDILISMHTKPLIWIGLFIGSTIGSLIPDLWGASMLSFSSIFLSGVGGILGIYVGYRYSDF